MHKSITATAIALCLSILASAAFGAAPAAKGKPLATCNDGTTMYSTTGEHRGACSGHKGVKAWADGSPVHTNKKTTEYR